MDRISFVTKPQNITTLIFDFGGVLINLDRQRCIDSFRTIGIDAEPFLSCYAQNGIFFDLENGTITPENFRLKVRELTTNIITDEQIDTCWNAFLCDIPSYKLELLLKLRRKGYNMLMLSNTNAIHFPLCAEKHFKYTANDGTKCQLDTFFHHCYLSYQLQQSKPKADIFHTLINDSNLKPQECYYLDDGEANINTAKQLGFNTAWVDVKHNLNEYLTHFI